MSRTQTKEKNYFLLKETLKLYTKGRNSDRVISLFSCSRACFGVFVYVQGRVEQGTDGLLSHTGLHLRYLPEVQQLMRH